MNTTNTNYVNPSDAFEPSEPRMVYFINETDLPPFFPCIAVENESGYYRTDWNWGNDGSLARKLCKERNEKMGYSEKDVDAIIVSTIRAQNRAQNEGKKKNRSK
jgi:hypothetical protein